jgi:hypothetical protein
MQIGTCRHWNGTAEKTCGAGVEISKALRSGSRPCCFAGSESECALYEDPSEEDVKAWQEETDRIIANGHERYRLLQPLLDRVREKYRGRDMQGHATCPVCGQKGKLTIAHVARNGSLHVFCETENCVRFME